MIGTLWSNVRRRGLLATALFVVLGGTAFAATNPSAMIARHDPHEEREVERQDAREPHRSEHEGEDETGRDREEGELQGQRDAGCDAQQACRHGKQADRADGEGHGGGAQTRGRQAQPSARDQLTCSASHLTRLHIIQGA